ncbi:MAG: hypothetical protein PHS44_06025 [Candidatus Dojkabacteria bacterium]|jgi:hypothetical protein|nr:hypothetical protein [Candidatus Dojkabacteria bacterium]
MKKIFLILFIATAVFVVAASLYWLAGGTTQDIANSVCTYNENNYNNGDSFPSIDKCNTCFCDEGEVACTEKACLDEEDYAGWKTYENDDYGFKFRYPKDWKIVLEQGSPYDGGDVNDEKYGYLVVVAKGSWNLSLVYKPYFDSTPQQLSLGEEITIRGVDLVRGAALAYDFESSGKIHFYSIVTESEYVGNNNGQIIPLFSIGGKPFEVTYSSSSAGLRSLTEWQEILPTLDKIAASLVIY